MKINRLIVSNVLGISLADISPAKPVVLFAGPNRSGKSSLYESLRMAIAGELPPRIGLKKDLPQIIHDGAQTGTVRVHSDVGQFIITLPGGKAEKKLPAATQSQQDEDRTRHLKWVMNAQAFAAMLSDERSMVLFHLMGLSNDGPTVKRILNSRGFSPEKMDAIRPKLAISFDAAEKEAAGKAREAKGVFKHLTGEQWGSEKGQAWEAPMPLYDPDLLAALEQDHQELTAIIEAQGETVGRLREQSAESERVLAKINGLRQQAGLITRARHKLAIDEKDLAAQQQMLEAVEGLAGKPMEAFGCPHCGGMVELIKAGAVVTGIREHTRADYDPEAAGRAEAARKAIALLESAVRNDRRDLDNAQRAEKELETWVVPDVSALQRELVAVTEARRSNQEQIRKLTGELRAMQEAAIAAKTADQRTEAAAKAHQDITEWLAISEAMAPSGVPSELLSEAIEPINRRLAQSAASTGWPVVHIGPDMAITVGGRRYSLESTSARWAADAMLAEAVSHLSGLKFLVLDGFDVLADAGAVKYRADLFRWIYTLTQANELDQALLFGTLKEPPKFPWADVFWVNAGQISQPSKEVA